MKNWNVEYFLATFISLTVNFISAQPTLQWQKTFGGSGADEGVIVRQTSDGGLALAGLTASTNGDVFGNHGSVDIWLIKLDAIGAVKWKRLYGGTKNEVPGDMQQTSDGGYIIAGFTTSDNLDVTGFHGNQDGWVLKISSQGEIEWQKALGGSGFDSMKSVKQTTDGGYIVAGYSRSIDGDVSINHGDFDFWIVKLTSSGELEWERSYGGSDQELARSVEVCLEGGYIVTGETFSTDGDISLHHGNDDFWIIKIDENGELEWESTYGGIAAEVAHEIHQTADGGYVVVGYTGSLNSGDVQGNEGMGFIDFWIIKISANGDLEWQKPLGGTDSDWGRSIVELSDGSFVATGPTRSSDGLVTDIYDGQEIWVVKLSSTGDLIWERTLGGSTTDESSSIIETLDNGFAIAGFTWSSDGDVSGSVYHGYNDCWLVKLAPETVNTEEAVVQTDSAIRIYPNPTTQMLNLSTAPGDPPTQVEITNLLGLLLLRAENESGKGIDVSALPPGFYLARVRTASGKISTEKFEKY